MIFKKILYKYTRLYETYKKVENIFVEPTLTFTSCKWSNYSGLPAWRHGPIIEFANGLHEYIDTPGAYGNWAKSTIWDPDFLKTKGWWGRTWRKYVRPHYQLPIWMAFEIYNHPEYVKSKWDYFSYEFPPQFSIVLFGWSFNWNLVAPRSTMDFMSEKTGRSYPDNDAYWESIYDYLYSNEEYTKLYNAVSTVYMKTLYTPAEKKKNSELFEYLKTLKDRESKEYEDTWKKIKKLGRITAYARCRPEYIKESCIKDYFNCVEDVKNSKKEYKNYIWL